MYGMVNLAIKECVIDHYGAEMWQRVEEKSGTKEDAFIRMQQYSDELTVSLVVAAAEVIEKSAGEFLGEMGENWVRER